MALGKELFKGGIERMAVVDLRQRVNAREMVQGFVLGCHRRDVGKSDDGNRVVADPRRSSYNFV